MLPTNPAEQLAPTKNLTKSLYALHWKTDTLKNVPINEIIAIFHRISGRTADFTESRPLCGPRQAARTTAIKLTRNSSGDEIANVNLLYDDIVHTLENAIDSCINSATDRFLQRRFTKFSEITQCNSHYVVQGHSRSPMLVPIESSYTTSY